MCVSNEVCASNDVSVCIERCECVYQTKRKNNGGSTRADALLFSMIIKGIF